MSYLLLFTIAAIFSTVATPLIKRLAFKLGVLDVPNAPRKIHKLPIPLMGGTAVFIAFVATLLIYLQFWDVDFDIVPIKFFLAIIFGGFTLIIGGALDDKYNLPPKLLWIFPAVASLIVVGSGIGVGITEISNPFGAPIRLDYVLLGIPLSGLIMWLWMMGMIFTTKFLDGLDGLCAGISLIGGLSLFALSLGDRVNQPITLPLNIWLLDFGNF